MRRRYLGTPVLWVNCSVCQRRLKGYVPKGGDGSQVNAPRHQAKLGGSLCSGSNNAAVLA